VKGLARGKELGREQGQEEGRKNALRDAGRQLLEQAGMAGTRSAPRPTAPPTAPTEQPSPELPTITQGHIKVLEALRSHFPATARQAQLEAATGLERSTIGPLLADLRDCHYAERPGGPSSRKGERITLAGLAFLRDLGSAH
jgi:hypothetical protein